LNYSPKKTLSNLAKIGWKRKPDWNGQYHEQNSHPP